MCVGVDVEKEEDKIDCKHKNKAWNLREGNISTLHEEVEEDKEEDVNDCMLHEDEMKLQVVVEIIPWGIAKVYIQ